MDGTIYCYCLLCTVKILPSWCTRWYSSWLCATTTANACSGRDWQWSNMTGQHFNDSCFWLSDCQNSVPLQKMTSPNPINVVIQPKATQVHCFSLQQCSSVSTVKPAFRYVGDLLHVGFLTIASRKKSMHHTHQGPIMLSTRRRDTLQPALHCLASTTLIYALLERELYSQL